VNLTFLLSAAPSRRKRSFLMIEELDGIPSAPGV
jgi:hypothetical protein